MAVVNKSPDLRWTKRYRLFCLGGLAVLSIQLFLAYLFFAVESNSETPTQEYLSGKGRLNLEVLDEHNGLENSRRLRDSYLVSDDDDDDSLGNSNAIYNKVKVPPDKVDSKSNKVPKISKLGEGNKTVTLRIEELDFTPMCDIRNKEAISAIHRASTQNCKQQIANTTCLVLSGDLYPQLLPHKCPAEGRKGKPLGCYQDDKISRLLKEYYINLKSTNSPENCINICLQSGFPYAGVQYGSECFCGVSEPLSSAKLPDSSCNMKCPADARQACGGFYTVNIYQTGVAKLSKEPIIETWSKKRNENNAESKVRIVFLLMLNGRAVRQVKRLIKALFHTSHFFYIHVDARQDYMMRELLELEMRFSNIRLCRRRQATIWGGASLLSILLQAMSELVESGWQWDFVINLSESDFPVKTNEQLVNFLTANKERNFVKSHGREVQRFIQKQGLDKTFVECDNHMWRIGDRILPTGIVVDGGSDWLALSKPFVEYLAKNQNDPLIQGLITIFKYTLLPAESFFHTVLRNSIYCNSYVDNNLHITNWRRRLGCKCQYKHIVDWCGCSPNNFKTEDWQRILATENKPVFFARKFEPVINQEVINHLDTWLYGNYPKNLPGLDKYWQSIYNSKDISPSPDDTLISLGHSLTRSSIRAVQKNCSLSMVKLLEIISYYESNTYKGSLIFFEAKSRLNSKSLKIESWIQHVEHFVILNNSAPSSRIKNVFVSSDFDQKEQTSRNNLRTIGPFTEPTAIVELNPGETLFNITILWIDPMANIAAIQDFIMEDSVNVNFVKPLLKSPLLPGVWTVKLVWKSNIFAQTYFLVVPLEIVSGSPINLQQTQFLHGGPGERYVKQNNDWAKIVGSQGENRSALERRAFSNSKRVGKDLNIWIDSLTNRFYQIVETCTTSVSEMCGLENCKKTNWSSLSPDPKSNMNMIEKTGRIIRW
ncbi:xylosyltransferase oxt [Cimex lectularius]|uniref:protein xylosyltransferase n=1 Tax=Cimex lectularius TaxID=79782 RepID=A0A8I6TGX0_CIMLE|nr:xylosyltransferase oxt [Cimex lectularius]